MQNKIEYQDNELHDCTKSTELFFCRIANIDDCYIPASYI